MGCFAVQRTKKKLVEEPPTKVEEPGNESEASSSSPSTTPRPTLSAPPSFRRTVRVIQNVQRFIIHSKPKPSSHWSRELKAEQWVVPSSDEGSPTSKPMPLPSPRVSPRPMGYALPLPSDHCDAVVISPNSHEKNIASASVGHGGPNSRVFPWELQPLPPLKVSFTVPRGMKAFTFEEIASACQYFSRQAAIGDDGFCFSGFVKAGGKGSKQQPQDVVVLRLHEKLHLGLKEWMPEIAAITSLQSSHLCKMIGSYGDDAKGERFLVYEKLRKGSLHAIMFEASDTLALDWPTRMKIIQGTIQGLAALHGKFPEQILYKDFRLSHIQVDNENSAKLSGYWFVTSNNQILQAELVDKSSKARESAYCAPETRRSGTVTLKSNVWSLGVVLLEILCGRKNKDERISKDNKHNLVKWAKPFLLEEDKVFLIMDPKLQGRFPSKGAKIMASLTLQCLQKDPTKRPSMKMALDMVKAAQETRQSNMLTWRERSPTELVVASSAPLLNLGSSQSLKPGIVERTTVSYMRSPTKFDLIQSPALKPLTIPSRACAD